nr:glutamate--tRNA ligase [Desulfovibrio sp.]
KLSKRHGARAVIEYEKDGLLPQALVNYLARLGWSHGDQEIFTMEELIEHFDGTNLNPAAAAFDPGKLAWCNARFMREMPLDDLADKVVPFAKDAGLPDVGHDRLVPLCAMFRERASDLKALAESFRPLLVPAGDLQYDEKDAKKHFTPEGGVHLKALAVIFRACEPFSAEPINDALNAYVADNGLSFKNVAPPLRTALMGFMGGSHLNEIMAFLGREEALARLERAISLCGADA